MLVDPSCYALAVPTCNRQGYGHCGAFLTVEMSAGQMLEDVMLSVCGRKPVYFPGDGRNGSAKEDILQKLREMKEQLG